jgi:hypothetical protein
MDVLHLRLHQVGPQPVQFKTRYLITILPQAQSLKGSPMAEPYTFSFTTDGPLILGSVPASGASDLMINMNSPIIVDTNALVDPTTVERALRIRPQPDSIPQIQYLFHEAGTRILIYTSLRFNTRFSVMLDNTLRTRDDQRFSNTPFSFTFRTANFGR